MTDRRAGGFQLHNRDNINQRMEFLFHVLFERDKHAFQTVMQLLYLRYRRLPPLIVMHWGMDLFSAIAMSSLH